MSATDHEVPDATPAGKLRLGHRPGAHALAAFWRLSPAERVARAAVLAGWLEAERATVAAASFGDRVREWVRKSSARPG